MVLKYYADNIYYVYDAVHKVCRLSLIPRLSPGEGGGRAFYIVSMDGSIM